MYVRMYVRACSSLSKGNKKSFHCTVTTIIKKVKGYNYFHFVLIPLGKA